MPNGSPHRLDLMAGEIAVRNAYPEFVGFQVIESGVQDCVPGMTGNYQSPTVFFGSIFKCIFGFLEPAPRTNLTLNLLCDERFDSSHRQKTPFRIAAQLGESKLPIELQRGLILCVRDDSERCNLRRFPMRHVDGVCGRVIPYRFLHVRGSIVGRLMYG